MYSDCNDIMGHILVDPEIELGVRDPVTTLEHWLMRRAARYIVCDIVHLVSKMNMVLQSLSVNNGSM